MLLSELEPGTMFKLTKAGQATEMARLAAAGGLPRAGVSEGPYQVLTPQRKTSTGGSLVTELYAPGKWFAPSPLCAYEVEIVDVPLTAGILPGRNWLFTSVDPEVFIERDGKIVPGFEILPPKKKPGFANEGGGIFHEDGFQAEFSPHANACHETVAYSMSHAINSMMEHANSKLHYTDRSRYTISDATFVELTPELLSHGTDDQVALGCDTSENVWGHPAFMTDNAREFPYRMAGGHIHLGKATDAKWFHSRAERIIRAMDVFLGVPSVALLAGMEDPRRRQFYGRAGEFRYQKHGLEYRVLSNAYLQHPSITHLVLNLARGAFRLGTTNWESQFKYDPELVRHIINDHDVTLAKKFVEENAELLIWIMDKDSGFGWGAKALTTIHTGAKAVFGDQLGIMKNWVTSSNRYEPQQFHRFVSQHYISPWGVPKGKEERPATPAHGVTLNTNSGRVTPPPAQPRDGLSWRQRAAERINDLAALQASQEELTNVYASFNRSRHISPPPAEPGLVQPSWMTAMTIAEVVEAPAPVEIVPWMTFDEYIHPPTPPEPELPAYDRFRDDELL